MKQREDLRTLLLMEENQQWQTTYAHTNPNSGPFSLESFICDAMSRPS